MRSIPLVSLVVALAASSAACDGGNGTIPFEQLPARLSESYCANVFRCCDTAERTDMFMNFNPPVTTEAECVTTLTALYQRFLVGDEAFAAGRMGYNGDLAADCLARLDGASCGADTQAALDSCEDGVFFGKVPVGGQCKGSDECAPDNTICVGATSTDFGVCTALPGISQACPDFQCVEAAYCDNNVCAAKKANGQTCGFSDECISDECNASNQCADPPVDNTCDGA